MVGVIEKKTALILASFWPHWQPLYIDIYLVLPIHIRALIWKVGSNVMRRYDAEEYRVYRYRISDRANAIC